MITYTPEDVYNYAIHGDSDKLITTLKFRENRINWYRDHTGGWNALHTTILCEEYDCIGILINSGIDVNSKTICRSFAALDIAASFGYTEYVELLLNKGADINSRDSINVGSN